MVTIKKNDSTLNVCASGIICVYKGGKYSKMKRIEYMCTYCGKKTIRSEMIGRPEPGRCPRKQGDKPHSWRINRTLV